MGIRRCSLLFLAVDDHPRFSMRSLVHGGDGLDRSSRLLAHAGHLDAAAELTLEELSALQALDSARVYEREEIAVLLGDGMLARLLQIGMLLDDDESSPQWIARDRQLRTIAWWPPAAIAQQHGRWQGVDIEARDALGEAIDVAGLIDAFGPPPEECYRRGNASDAIALGRVADRPFDDLLAARSTCRNFDPLAAVGADELATMLRRTFGAVGTRLLGPGAVAVKKTSPGGGALHAVEAYLLVQRAEGLDPGLYHYLAMEHAVEPIQTLDADQAAAMTRTFVAGQWWFEAAPALVIMTARYDRLYWKYRRHSKAWRVTQLDAGHLSQTLYLSAADLGLGAFVTCAINDIDIEQALGLDPIREGVVAICGFGRRAITRSMLELDDLTPTSASLRLA